MTVIMKLFEALAEVKTLKERLVQVSNFRQSSIIYDADSEPDFKYEELSQQIDNTLDRITELKLAVEAANLAHTVTVGREEIPLAKAILELSNIRTKLTYISNLLNLEKSDIFGRVRRTKEDVVQRWQKTPAELLQLQGEYQKRKNLVDAAIQEANHRVTVAV